MVIRPELDAQAEPAVAPRELHAAALDAVEAAVQYLDECHFLDGDLEVENASVRALLALARHTLVWHEPISIGRRSFCPECKSYAWPCARADLALRAVGALSRGVTTTTTSAPNDGSNL